jgi:hypothetical protein
VSQVVGVVAGADPALAAGAASAVVGTATGSGPDRGGAPSCEAEASKTPAPDFGEPVCVWSD